MKYSILLSNVGGRDLSLKLISKNVVLLEVALLCLPPFLAYCKHIIPYLKPVGPDELENSLFARFLRVAYNLLCIITSRGWGIMLYYYINIFAANHRIHDYSYSDINRLQTVSNQFTGSGCAAK